MGKRLDLFVFSDALGWEQVTRRDFMPDVFPIRKPCQTIFGYSCTCDPSILTGTLPRDHGHFSFFVYDPVKSPFGWAKWFGWLPSKIAGYHRVRNVVSRWTAHANGYTGYFQLYSTPFSRLGDLDYTEKHDIYELGGIINGQETFFEEWKRSGKKWQRSDWRRGDVSNVAALKSSLENDQPEMAYLFTAGLDAVMHRYGTDHPEVDKAYDQFESWVREIRDIASKHYDDVDIYIFSDHGMSDVKETSSLWPDFEKQGWKFGRDVASAWDSTMARFWFPGGDTVQQEVEQWLSSRKEGFCVSDEQHQCWGSDFEDKRYGELFYLLNEGTLFVPSYMNLNFVTGMHGYAPECPGSEACWVATRDVSELGVSPPKQIHEIHHVAKAVAGGKV